MLYARVWLSFRLDLDTSAHFWHWYTLQILQCSKKILYTRTVCICYILTDLNDTPRPHHLVAKPISLFTSTISEQPLHRISPCRGRRAEGCQLSPSRTTPLHFPPIIMPSGWQRNFANVSSILQWSRVPARVFFLLKRANSPNPKESIN